MNTCVTTLKIFVFIALLCSTAFRTQQVNYFTRAFFATPDCGSDGAFDAIVSIPVGYCLDGASSAYQCVGPHSDPSEYNVWRTTYPTRILRGCHLDEGVNSKTVQLINSTMPKNECIELDSSDSLAYIDEAMWRVSYDSKIYMKFECSESIFGSFASLIFNNTNNTDTVMVSVWNEDYVRCPSNGDGGVYAYTAVNGKKPFEVPGGSTFRELTCHLDRLGQWRVRFAPCSSWKNETCKFGVGDAYSLTPSEKCYSGFNYFCTQMPYEEKYDGLVNISLVETSCWPDFCTTLPVDDNCLPNTFPYTNDTTLLPSESNANFIINVATCGEDCNTNQQQGTTNCRDGCNLGTNYTLNYDFGLQVLSGVLRIDSQNKTACYHYAYTSSEDSNYFGVVTQRNEKKCRLECWDITARSSYRKDTYWYISSNGVSGGTAYSKAFRIEVTNLGASLTDNGNGGNGIGSGSTGGGFTITPIAVSFWAIYAILLLLVMC